jgi:uncharacterized protein
MPPVVCNSSPLIALEQIGHLLLLESLFGEVWVPEAVVQEVIPSVSLPPFVKPCVLHHPQAARLLQVNLGPGESEAIALALQEQARLIILDDRPARRAAQGLGLRVVGTLGILLAAKQHGLISDIKSRITALEHYHFHVSPTLVKQVLISAGEAS